LLPDVKEGGDWRASGDEVLRVSFGCSFGCRIRHVKGSGRCAGTGEGG
jgi:hypothetical protein